MLSTAKFVKNYPVSLNKLDMEDSVLMQVDGSQTTKLLL